MTEIDKIEREQNLRFEKKKSDLFSLIDKHTRKQLSFIASKLKFMFKNDRYGTMNAESLVFQCCANSPLTLNEIQSLILSKGQEFAKKTDIETMLNIFKDEAIKYSDKNKAKLSPEKQNKFNELLENSLNNLYN